MTTTTHTPKLDTPKLKTSAMIASFADEGQKTTPAPFGHALVAAARENDKSSGSPPIWANTPTCMFSPRPSPTGSSRWAWPNSYCSARPPAWPRPG